MRRIVSFNYLIKLAERPLPIMLTQHMENVELEVLKRRNMAHSQVLSKHEV